MTIKLSKVSENIFVGDYVFCSTSPEVDLNNDAWYVGIVSDHKDRMVRVGFWWWSYAIRIPKDLEGHIKEECLFNTPNEDVTKTLERILRSHTCLDASKNSTEVEVEKLLRSRNKLIEERYMLLEAARRCIDSLGVVSGDSDPDVCFAKKAVENVTEMPNTLQYQEPWCVDMANIQKKGDDIISIRNCYGAEIATVSCGVEYAKRIVECVNALRGIKDPEEFMKE